MTDECHGEIRPGSLPGTEEKALNRHSDTQQDFSQEFRDPRRAHVSFIHIIFPSPIAVHTRRVHHPTLC